MLFPRIKVGEDSSEPWGDTRSRNEYFDTYGGNVAECILPKWLCVFLVVRTDGEGSKWEAYGGRLELCRCLECGPNAG